MSKVGGNRKRPKTGGRQKGTPNKLTATIRDAITTAFEEVGAASYLAKVAKEHPQVFCTLLGKVLPTQLSGPDDGPIKYARADMTDEERERRIAELTRKLGYVPAAEADARVAEAERRLSGMLAGRNATHAAGGRA